MSQNELEWTETRCSYQRPALERVRVVSYNGSCQLVPYIRQKNLGKLSITQRPRASKDMEFRVNSTSCRLKASSEFLLNKLLKFCQLVNGLQNQVELVNFQASFPRSFFVFQNRTISFSYVLNLLQNNSVNHAFSIVIKTPSNCP